MAPKDTNSCFSEGIFYYGGIKKLEAPFTSDRFIIAGLLMIGGLSFVVGLLWRMIQIS